ncbi:syntaxin [Clathrospora elynae]|uniref:Syntaxin n=1 Tax=Clathrospora elynae TaxID=706981 RepID=A0A6A5SXZ6_9PLEO|nr:syntaxin [Clathrospora elynae]
MAATDEQYGNKGYGQIGSQGGNPYAQRDDSTGGDGYYDNSQGSLEMQSYSGGGANPNAILNECREVDRALDDLDQQLSNLDRIFRQSLARPDMPSGEITNLSSQIMTGYRGLVSRVKNIKSKPESGSPRNAPQVGKVDRRLKATINKYQTLEADFRRESQVAAERQYRIVRPDATDAEVRDAVSNPNAPIFQQALLNTDRRDQASSTLRNVKERHEAIQNIERQMVELAQLFQDLDQIVQQQEPLVANIEQKGEEVRENVEQGNVEMGGAIEKARSRNRKKWWCLLIVLLIIIVIVIIAVVVTQINKSAAKAAGA